MKFYRFFRHEFIFFIFFVLLISFSIKYPKNILYYPSYVHWETIFTLCGLLIITTSIKESGYIDLFALKILKNVKYERNLAFYLVLLAGILSTFLTNDISLFIVIPITLSLKKIIKEDISKLIIFEALAVNAGSTLTPIGNPQNIYLWHKWGCSFIYFMLKMFPIFAIQMAVLLLFLFFSFKKRELKIKGGNENRFIDKKLFLLSIFLFFLFIIFLELGFLFSILLVIFFIYFLINKKILKKVDWILIILFIIIFIDFNIIANLKFVINYMNKFNLFDSKKVFIFSALVSQIMSNVPASVFMSKFSENWLAVSCGVNIGGNGLFIASLANIIALRMAKNKKIWLGFHKYSMPYLILNLILGLYIVF